jgi:UDP-N-acetylmuramoyl-L-alanyl-D-glutamate--2,6-diaminopimelate ligase
MTLIELLQNIVVIDPKLDHVISNITDDSRLLKPGDLFFAYQGEKQDGRKFLEQVVAKGASALVCEAKNMELFNKQYDLPLILIPDLRSKIGSIAAKFYGYPSKQMDVIGITGTSGKTSCSHFIATALHNSGIKCGIIGTLGSGFPNVLSPNINTTPGAIILQQQLSAFLQQQAKVISMEVSSHSLEQGRVNGIDFSIGVFTNLSHEHLDYHGDMRSYGESKKRLFLDYNLHHAVINADDVFGKQLLAAVAKKTPTIAYSIMGAKSDFDTVRVSELKTHDKGFTANVMTPWGNGILTSKLLGRFNVSNMLATLSVLLLMEMPLEQALHQLMELQTVTGRMNAFGGGELPLVVVDFAHKPDALEKVLIELREHCHGKLWCVFGCGGDRDRAKRPLMGRIAESYSDYVVITDDNPRTENSQQIVDDIVNGLLCPRRGEVLHDRATAIAYAVNNAKSGDVILVAGKGHETYQLIGNEKIAFSDIEQVKTLLGE